MERFVPAEKGIVLAADLPSPDDNFRVVEDVADLIVAIKVGLPQILDAGLGVIGRYREHFGLPVIADLKIADVPHTNVKLVRLAADAGASAVFVHGLTGVDSLEACQAEAGSTIGLIVQTEFTNPGGREMVSGLTLDVARLGVLVGTYGFQAPGNRPVRIAEIREVVGTEPAIFCCGVGAQGGSYRVAIQAGGDYPIVGRAIYQADDPRAATAAFLAE